MSAHSVCLKPVSLGIVPCTANTFCLARGPKAIRQVLAAACSGLSARASSESSSSAMQVEPSPSTNTPRRVRSFIARLMVLCNAACSTSSVGAGISTNSGELSLPRRYTPSLAPP